MLLRRATHRAIAGVTESLESFAFNVAVARIHEFANAIGDAERADGATPGEPGLAWARREAGGMLARLLSPMMPHLAEEIGELLFPGVDLVAEQPWPRPDPVLLAQQSVTIAVQIMGKLRATIEMAPDAPAEAVIAAAENDPRIAVLMAGQRVVKRIHVPGRIVNFVLGV